MCDGDYLLTILVAACETQSCVVNGWIDGRRTASELRLR